MLLISMDDFEAILSNASINEKTFMLALIDMDDVSVTSPFTLDKD